MNKLAFVSGLAAALCVTSAIAADLPSRKAPVYVPPPPPIFTWTGFYIGATVGGSASRQDVVTSIAPGNHIGVPANLAAISAAGTGPFGKLGGFSGGGEAGFNYQISRIVLGVEGDISVLDNRRTFNSSGVLTTGDSFLVGTETRSDYLASIRGRLGFAFDRILLFATGGVAFTNLRTSQVYFDTLAGPTSGSFSRSIDKTGWTVGGGAEVAIFGPWSVKGEYLYSRFEGGGGGAYPVVAAASGGSNVISVAYGRREIHTGRAALNYRFGWAPDAPVVARY